MLAAGLLGLVAGLVVACESAANHHALGGTPAPNDAAAVFDVPGDGAYFCGNEVHQVVSKPPLLYFVMDASGSMSEIASGQQSRYQLLEAAAVDLVSKLGGTVRVGAAVFPKQSTNKDTCAAGTEVMAPAHGGAATTAAFKAAIAVGQSGGTPTAATLEGLAPKFANAAKDPEGIEAVLLVTDGGPNCDLTATCSASECIPNIDGLCPVNVANCCDPASGGTGGNCLDKVATLQAIQHVVKGGAKLYVIGLAVGSAYEGTLEQMALLGGGAQATAPFYYRVDDLQKLEDTFRTIVSGLVSCDYKLLDPPTEQDLTNVYLDGTLLLQDPQNGWVWMGNDEIVLVGDACAKLKSGAVSDVQVVSGCPTETPK